MEIILPNDTIEFPSIWDTEKEYENQSDMAKDYVMNVFNRLQSTIDYEGRRPIKNTYIDNLNNIQIVVNTSYRYDIDHKACFTIQNQIITLENI